MKRLISITSAALLTAAMLPGVAAAQDDMEKPNIAFLPGIVDPFYQVMEQGILKAGEDFGLDIQVAQYPDYLGYVRAEPDPRCAQGPGQPGLPHHRSGEHRGDDRPAAGGPRSGHQDHHRGHLPG